RRSPSLIPALLLAHPRLIKVPGLLTRRSIVKPVVAIALLLSTFAPVFAQVLSSSDTAKALHQLFDEDWQWSLREFPEAATLMGDNHYNDRLTDYSPDAIARRKSHEREMLGRIRKI